jgi:hypothetical protein
MTTEEYKAYVNNEIEKRYEEILLLLEALPDLIEQDENVLRSCCKLYCAPVDNPEQNSPDGTRHRVYYDYHKKYCGDNWENRKEKFVETCRKMNYKNVKIDFGGYDEIDPIGQIIDDQVFSGLKEKIRSRKSRLFRL